MKRLKLSEQWKKLPCKENELQLNVLTSGQTFRWHRTGENIWTGVIGEDVWKLSRDDDYILYKKINTSNNKTEENESSDTSTPEAILKDYFQLDVNLEEKYEEWSRIDPNFKEKGLQYPGIRILRLDPVETLFSFICSSNNNIPRITKMVSTLCTFFGKKIATLDGITYSSFPTISRLCGNDVPARLRENGFGYRASYIANAAKHIMDNYDSDWLYSLRKASYDDAFTSLQALPGVGPKVADCVCLMALDKTSAVPIDTHMLQIARQSYLPHLKKLKSLTPSAYKQIGEHFRTLHGEYAGWAQTVLFIADLKKK